MSPSTTSHGEPSAPASADPIDQLVPPPARWWMRLVLGASLVVVVGAVGFLWRMGYIRPAPDCCGSGSASPLLGRADTADAVVITAYFFNSSSRDVVVTGATAELPGARVVSVRPFSDPNTIEIPPRTAATLPSVVHRHQSARFAITFRPDRCDTASTAPATAAGAGAGWGSLVLELSVGDDPWWPTIDRRFTAPEPIVRSGDAVPVFESENEPWTSSPAHDVLAAACRLLGR